MIISGLAFCKGCVLRLLRHCRQLDDDLSCRAPFGESEFQPLVYTRFCRQSVGSPNPKRKAKTKLNRIKPEEIIAVIVGIEKYADESLKNVPGPASDAVRLFRWLRDCDVPAENIRLHLSPLEETRLRFNDDLNANGWLAARFDEINVSLNDFPENHPDAKLLIVYWCGHGAYFHAEREQMLLLENATTKNRICLNTDSLRKFLEENFWQQTDCLQRLVFIDSCAEQRKFDNLNPVGLPIKAIDRTRKMSKIALCEMRSASLGQFAHIGRHGEIPSAHFSNALLDWLDGGDLNWLLNKTRNLIERLEVELRAACKDNDFDQRPVFWQLGDWDGKAKLQRFPLEAEWMEDAERLLRGLNIADNQFGAIYRRIADRLGGRARANSLMEMIEDLCEPRPARKDKTGLPPLLEFVARVADSGLPSEAEHEALWQLVEKHLDGNQLATLRNTLATETRQGQISGERLSFDLMISSEAPGKFIFKAKRQTNAGDYVPFSNLPKEALTLAEIESVVADCIADSDQPFVEFFLPGDLLSLAVDRWKDEDDSPIGKSIPVVVRFRERWAGQISQLAKTNWERVSNRIHRSAQSGAEPKAYWVSQLDENLKGTIETRDYGDCVALAVQPKPEMLRAVLNGGAPYVFWPRQTPADGAKFKKALNGKLRAKHLNSFPESVRDLRLDARKPGDPGSELTLLWDEPTPVPLKKFTPLV